MKRCFLVLLMLFFHEIALSATHVPTELDIQEVRERVTLSDIAAAVAETLLAELEFASGLLVQLDDRRFDLIEAQREAASFAEQALELEDEIQRLMIPARIDFSDTDEEQRLRVATDQLELEAGQLRQTLFNAREYEAWLHERANSIGEQMKAVADTIQSFGATTRISAMTNSAIDGASMQPFARQVQTLVNRTKAYVAIETIILLRGEQTTLGPRQTLASLQSRAHQLRLERSRQTLDQHWRQLNLIRIDHARSRLAALVDEGRAAILGTDFTSATMMANRVKWTNAEIVLLEKELPLLRRTAKVTESILKTYEIRRVLARINSTGTVNDSLNEIFRTLRDDLPDVASLGNELHQIRENQRELRVDRILLESVLHGLGDSGVISVDRTPLSSTSSNGSLVELVNLLGVTNRLVDRLVMLEAALSEARVRSDEVGLILDGSVLWLRSNESASLVWFTNGYHGLQWLTSSDSWRTVGEALMIGFQAKPRTILFLLLILTAVSIAHRRIKSLLEQAAEGVGKVGEDRYWSTPIALGTSALLALPVPLLLGLLWWQIQSNYLMPGSLISALSGSLLETALVVFVLLFFKALCRPNGVFCSHFEWNDLAVNRLYRHLSWFIWVCALCTALITLAVLGDRSELRYGLGVFAFVMISVAMSALLQVCLRPNRGVAYKLTDSFAQSLVARVAIWILIVFPLVVGILPFLGYFDTAVEIQTRAFSTGVYLMAVVVLIGLAMREFMVAHRRMSFRKALAKRAAREAERAAQQNAPVSGDAAPDLSFAWDDDYKRVANQAKHLFRIAGAVLFLFIVWMVWKPLFPVLDIFNDIVLWQSSTSDDPTSGELVTLSKLLFALGVIVLGIVGSRNLRGLLEILIFERLKLDTGARYAIHAIASYTLVGTALLLGIAQLGVDWSRLQWIIAALGVGLGFGLQEIVANFISGLIILFERPIRVGDTVTIGGISGTVSNIQIRATTLTDFDNREVLLPNKSIITENVTNWTLNNAVTRILLTIGVAYGSHIQRVRALLKECVDANEDVLKTPEPTVFFMRHGDSSLDFEIRIFVATPAHRLSVMHAMNAAISQTLAVHGIEVPFPQRVMHMRSDTVKSSTDH